MSALRQACDRCHDKKLRCPRAPGELTCSRCSRAGAPCLFSPPTRGPRNAAFDMAFDWSPVMALDEPQCPPCEDFMPPSLPLSSGPTSDATESSETGQLVDIIVALDRIWRRLTVHNLHHVSREHLKEYVDGLGGAIGLHMALEQLLLFAQRLLVLYPSAFELATKNVTAAMDRDSCDIPDCIHQDDNLVQPESHKRQIDHAMLNMLFACHLRLIDIFDSLADHGRMCSRLAAALPPDYDATFDIPQVRFGAFVAPKEAAASMLISMLVELHQRLAFKNQELSGWPCFQGQDTPNEIKMTRLQCEVIRDRAENTLQGLETLKEALTKAGVMN